MNYTELVDNIKAYSENYEMSFVAKIPTFVAQAERRIYNSCYIPELRKRVYASLVAADNRFPLPDDFLALFSAAIRTDTGTGHSYNYLVQKDPDFILEAFPDSSITGTPQYYAIIRSSEIILGPTPASGSEIQYDYYYYPESIVTASTTWVGDNYEQVLLYGALKEASIYMKGEPEIISMYDRNYMEGLAQLRRMGEGLDMRDSFRSGQPRVTGLTGGMNG